jgi:hypothetical protein
MTPLRITTLIMLAGCAKATYVGPIDGHPAYKIDCSTLSSCQDKARDLCGGAFEERNVVDKAQQPGHPRPGNEDSIAIVAVCK